VTLEVAWYRKCPAVRGDQVVKALEKVGFLVVRVRGSHHVYGTPTAAELPSRCISGTGSRQGHLAQRPCRRRSHRRGVEASDLNAGLRKARTFLPWLRGQIPSAGPCTVRRFARWQVGATLADQRSTTARQQSTCWCCVELWWARQGCDEIERGDAAHPETRRIAGDPSELVGEQRRDDLADDCGISARRKFASRRGRPA